MLIIEGTDLTGKTTLANMFLKEPFFQTHGYVYQHLSLPSSGFDHCQQYVDLASKRVIQDRFHMSEIVYSAAIRDGDTKLYPERYRWVDAHLRLLGAFTVIITADDELLRERMGEGEMYSIDQIIIANCHYTNIANHQALKHRQIDWDYHIHCTTQSPFVIEHDLADIIRMYTRRQELLP